MTCKLLIALVVCGLFSWAIPALSQKSPALEEYVVEIQSQDKKLLGSGSIVSFTGIVLTAKHILYDSSDAGAAGAPNYMTTVRVRFEGDDAFDEADLVAVHPFLDIAVLQLRAARVTRIPAKLETDLGTIRSGKPAMVIGHVIATGELNQSHAGPIDQIDRHGHVIIGRGVREGTSGGPAFVGDRQFGIVRSSGVNRSIVVPIGRAVDYFRMVGILFTEKGVERRVGDMLGLARKVDQYERILADIQQDYNWVGAVTNVLNDDSQLQIEIQRKLDMQPVLKARATLAVVPIFGSKSFQKLPSDSRLGFRTSGWIEARQLNIGNLWKDIDANIRDYDLQSIKLKMDEVVGLDIKVLVYSIRDTGYVRPPRPLAICFALRFGEYGKRGLVQGPAVGGKCGEEFSYVDRWLPKLGM